MTDFTLSTYKLLLELLLKQKFNFIQCSDYFNRSTQKTIIFRHDVDKLPFNSLQTAKIENELGIKGTYYFRIIQQSYNTKIIKEIASLGHEIGYHYEDLTLARGDFKKAIQLFERHLNQFKELYPVRTICMHGSPLSKYDSRNLWKQYNYRDYGIIGEPYFDIDFSKVLYLTDTGRRWDGEKVSIRDKVRSEQLASDSQKKAVDSGQWADGRRQQYRTTFDIIKAAEQNALPDKIMITVHPQRWNNNAYLWAKELVMQNVKNVVKRVLVK